MTKTVFAYILSALFIYSCSSAGQMQSPESMGSEDDTVTERGVAPWYDHLNKATTDSLEFTGLGMAIAADSAEAMEVSMTQASANLEFAIDSYAESLRRELADAAGESGLSSGAFIQSLRRAVSSLQFSERDVSETVVYEIKENGAVVAYSRVSVQRQLAIGKLASSIDNTTFSSSLRETMSL